MSEETKIPEDYTRADMKPGGMLTFQLTATNDGRPGYQHQSQYVYEIELSKDVVPRLNDGEVENFELMTLERCRQRWQGGIHAKSNFDLHCSLYSALNRNCRQRETFL